MYRSVIVANVLGLVHLRYLISMNLKLDSWVEELRSLIN